MSQMLGRLNLRPQERRLVVIVGLILFVVLNLWFVWPHFKDWERMSGELKKARTSLDAHTRETNPARITAHQASLKQLEGEAQIVLPTEQSLDLIRAIQNQAARSGVAITANSEVTTSSATKTNEFFEEKARLINVTTGEKELVNFLVALGSADSLIRVRDMNLRPDPSQTRLQGRITLVASYQKKRPAAELAQQTAPPAQSTRTR